MSYLLGLVVVAVLLGASAAVALVAIARLVEILPPLVGADEQEDRGPAGAGSNLAARQPR